MSKIPIPPKDYLSNVLKFIDYLDENVEVFKQDLPVFDKMQKLRERQGKLKPHEKYGDRKEYDNIQEQIINIGQEELIAPNLIESKAKELLLIESTMHTTEVKNKLAIYNFINEDIKPDEIELILESKKKYMNFRKQTDFNPFWCGPLLEDMERGLREFYSLFVDVSDMERIQLKPPTSPPKVDPIETIVNNFDNNDIDTVIDHFKDLEKYMKNGEFIEWIRQAFETMAKWRKYTLDGGISKKEVRSIFYSYWIQSGKKHGTKEGYVRLLSDYFEDFPYSSTDSNFSK